MQFVVAITETFRVYDNENFYVVYKLTVKNGHESWEILKRYSHFDELKQQIKNIPHLPKSIQLPEFPPKERLSHLFQPLDKKKLYQRKCDLENYIISVVRDAYLKSLTCVKQFLKVESDNPYGVSECSINEIGFSQSRATKGSVSNSRTTRSSSDIFVKSQRQRNSIRIEQVISFEENNNPKKLSDRQLSDPSFKLNNINIIENNFQNQNNKINNSDTLSRSQGSSSKTNSNPNLRSEPLTLLTVTLVSGEIVLEQQKATYRSPHIYCVIQYDRHGKYKATSKTKKLKPSQTQYNSKNQNSPNTKKEKNSIKSKLSSKNIQKNSILKPSWNQQFHFAGLENSENKQNNIINNNNNNDNDNSVATPGANQFDVSPMKKESFKSMGNLKVTVWDKHKVFSDDKLGSITIPLNEENLEKENSFSLQIHGENLKWDSNNNNGNNNINNRPGAVNPTKIILNLKYSISKNGMSAIQPFKRQTSTSVDNIKVEIGEPQRFSMKVDPKNENLNNIRNGDNNNNNKPSFKNVNRRSSSPSQQKQFTQKRKLSDDLENDFVITDSPVKEYDQFSSDPLHNSNRKKTQKDYSSYSGYCNGYCNGYSNGCSNGYSNDCSNGYSKNCSQCQDSEDSQDGIHSSSEYEIDDIFSDELVQCLFCEKEYFKDDTYTLEGCQHTFCSECLSTNIDIHQPINLCLLNKKNKKNKKKIIQKSNQILNEKEKEKNSNSFSDDSSDNSSDSSLDSCSDSCSDSSCLDSFSSESCQVPIPDWILKNILGSKAYERHVTERFEALISSSDHIFRCPNPKCDVIIERVQKDEQNVDQNDKESEDVKLYWDNHRFRCPGCSLDFCDTCFQIPYHTDFTCEGYKNYLKCRKCIFCQEQLPQDTPLSDKTCDQKECKKKLKNSCGKTHSSCQHRCCGVKNEKECLYCLVCAEEDQSQQKQNTSDFCSICWVEDLGSAPCISLENCGHVFHAKCLKNKIKSKWNGAGINFSFLECPLCKKDINHPYLQELLEPFQKLRTEIEERSLERLVHEGLQNCDQIKDKDSIYFEKPKEYALSRYQYFQCFKCQNPYFGGAKQCDDGNEALKPEELICGTCSGLDRVDNCPIHGTQFIQYKCKFCCKIASWHCWGTTHFCVDCHNQQLTGDYLTRKKPSEFKVCGGADSCPLKVDHPHIQEFSLGCMLCTKRM